MNEAAWETAPPFSCPVHLQLATDADFDWLLGDESLSHGREAEAALAPPEALQLIRTFWRNWLVLANGRVVGIISILFEPQEGECEIGYGIAPACSGRGLASGAVEALLPILTALGIGRVIAGTAVGNPASQQVLVHNGFERFGERHDKDDGLTWLWGRAVGPA